MPARHISTHQRAKRDVITGWSPSTVRRQTKWLYSVQAEQLSGHGYGLTLTMRDTPADRDELDRAFRAYMLRLRRLGFVRLHWVMELQRRGTPHYHLAVYTPEKLPRGGWELIEHWLAVAEPWGASWGSQKVVPLQDVSGWLQYLSKHASRSVAHYQRQGMPPGWEKTGRLWGHRGDWPTVGEPMRFSLSREGWFRYRRLVRSWRLADARTSRDPKTRARRITSARKMLAAPSRELGETRGTSEWIPEHVQIALLGMLADQGYEVHQEIEVEPTESPLVRRLQRTFHEGLSDAP